MAKEVVKKVEGSKKTVVAAKKTSKAKASVNIAKVSESILDKLRALNLAPALQSDIVWCLGSYGHDRNPVGLIEKAEQALVLFKSEQAKKTKGVTAKFISDIESVLASN